MVIPALEGRYERKENKLVDIKIVGNKLTITCELGSGVPSKSGKTSIVATTNGFIPVEGSNYKVSINVIAPRK